LAGVNYEEAEGKQVFGLKSEKDKCPGMNIKYRDLNATFTVNKTYCKL
jgi:hypothetical protein